MNSTLSGAAAPVEIRPEHAALFNLPTFIRVLFQRNGSYCPPRYHYPKSSIRTPNQLPSGQTWLTAKNLLDERGTHLLRDLLEQLENDGYDVSGASLEYWAFIHHLEELTYATERLRQIAEHLERTGLTTIRNIQGAQS